ncbi:transmembrane protein 150A-like [Salvelinus alpinus]|uniref:transmembrane protein 150A-like n=1 Tax=Salvelinus alpinus TaxID=8036 RepID=UPI0039FBBD2B
MVMDGISESPHKTWSESEDKVREMIFEKLKMDHRKNEVERAHRTGNPTTGPGDRTRPIVVKFLGFKDKVAVLERAKNLRGTYIFLNKDYPEAVLPKRIELIPAMKAARARGDIAYICYDRLIVHPPSQMHGSDERAKHMDLMLIGLLRYAHVIEKHQNCVLNTASLSTGWICAAGVIVVGNFQVDYAKVLHYVGAGVAFPTSILFVCPQSALTYRLAKTHGEYNVGHLRLGMSLLAFITLVLSDVFFIQESFALQHASAIFEWLFCIIIMLFFGTFAFEFGDMSGDTLMVLARGGGVQGFSSSDHKAEEAGGPNHHYQPDGIAML